MNKLHNDHNAIRMKHSGPGSEYRCAMLGVAELGRQQKTQEAGVLPLCRVLFWQNAEKSTGYRTVLYWLRDEIALGKSRQPCAVANRSRDKSLTKSG
jgi:hypothetical protein